MEKVRNPFVTGGYISVAYFCDREKESEELIRKMTNGNNVVIISPRRMGKTGLIEHCFHYPEIENNFYTFFIDIYATSSLKEFVFKLGKEIFEALKPKGKKFIDNFFASISSLRPAFRLDSLTGMPSFDIGFGEIREPAFTLEEIFQYLETADKPCIVAIDEFQQIAKYAEKNVEAVLRTHVQHCRNTSFVFAGSQRHLMHHIFMSSSQPFYQSAGLLQLNAIAKDKYRDFVKHHFENGEKKIPGSVIDRVYDLFEGHTWYMQSVFNELYSFIEKGETCTLDLAKESIKNKIDSYEPLFQNTLSLLSEKQRELLYAIAKEGKAKGITSGAFIKKHGLPSSSSVQTAAKQLLGKEIITAEDNTYHVYDRFFGLWLAKIYGTGYII
ncbi:MAG: ATP-binding protein [Mangrovibacterium sp.]